MTCPTYDQRMAIGAGIAQALLDSVGMRASAQTIYEVCYGHGVNEITTDLIEDRLREMVTCGYIVAGNSPLDGATTNINDEPWYTVTGKHGYTKLWYIMDDARRWKAER